MNDILDSYIKTLPSKQNMVDIFKGEWSSKLPSLDGSELVAGQAELFDDHRIKSLNEYFPLNSKRVLELGPLEAGHTFMAHQYGATILAVESNSRAFMKCLIVKEMFNLLKAHFVLGDAVEYMKNTKEHFDLCMASGILYHAAEPFEFIELCSKMSDAVFVWTHYYDDTIMGNYPNLKGRFAPEIKQNWQDKDWSIYPFTYQESLEWKGFCGGPLAYSHWVAKADLFDAFSRNGLNKHHVFFEDTSHPNGPNICFLAQK